jgi:hypothetical protein
LAVGELLKRLVEDGLVSHLRRSLMVIRVHRAGILTHSARRDESWHLLGLVALRERGSGERNTVEGCESIAWRVGIGLVHLIQVLDVDGLLSRALALASELIVHRLHLACCALLEASEPVVGLRLHWLDLLEIAEQIVRGSEWLRCVKTGKQIDCLVYFGHVIRFGRCSELGDFLLLCLFDGVLVVAGVLYFLVSVTQRSLILQTLNGIFEVLHVLLELLALVLVEPSRVVTPFVVIGPLPVDVFIGKELGHFEVGGVAVRLSEVLGEVFLPERVDQSIGEVLEEFDLPFRPFV